MKTQVYISSCEQDTEKFGAEIAEKMKPGTVVAMYGGLGMGKTAFTRGMAKGLGLGSRVNSPTFTIVNEYLGDVPLFHFDMYRLGSDEELFEIGWEDYLDRGGICAVEWSENVEEAFPEDTVRVEFFRIGDTERRIEVTMPEAEVEK